MSMPVEETVIAEWYAKLIRRPMGDDTTEDVVRACLAGMFYTAASLVENWEVDAGQFSEVERITLAIQKCGWDEEFVLRLSKKGEA